MCRWTGEGVDAKLDVHSEEICGINCLSLSKGESGVFVGHRSSFTVFLPTLARKESSSSRKLLV